MTINPVQVIRKKRDGGKLSSEEINQFIEGAVHGTIPEYQTSALLMATFFQGMDIEEATTLTRAMIASGRRVQFTDGKPKVDKHSTGGVGDKVSLILAPLVASLGVDVPMVSGRGLGHTGGTLDKLESIPGFRVRISIDEFIDFTQKHGMAMMGQTNDFVPADKLLYSLRDVTSTVECIPLITASILSKKVAEGISGLVLDIKVGSGAFMKTQKEAERLAKWLVNVGTELGLKVRAVITDMNQPLGLTIGHSLEVLECIDVLKGNGPSDLRETTLELAAHMLVLGEKASALTAARSMAKKALADGRALAKFEEMCRIQGATTNVVVHPKSLSVSSHTLPICAPRAGFISKIDGESLGMLLVRLGGGRKKTTDSIDSKVGFVLKAKIGTRLKKGEEIVRVYYDPARLSLEGLTLESLGNEVISAFSFSGIKTKAPTLVKKVIE